MTAYTPIIVLGAIAAAFAIGSVAIAPLTGPKRYNRAKLDRYESGIEPSPLPEGGGKVSIRYFIIAMLFIVFDIEIIFLYPFAVAFDALGWFGLIEMFIFMADGVHRLCVRLAPWRPRMGLEEKLPSGSCSRPSRDSPATCARPRSGPRPSGSRAARSR